MWPQVGFGNGDVEPLIVRSTGCILSPAFYLECDAGMNFHFRFIQLVALSVGNRLALWRLPQTILLTTHQDPLR